MYARSWIAALLVASSAIASPHSDAQESAEAADSLSRLDNALLDLKRESNAPEGAASEIAALRSEIADIRRLLDTLQETLDNRLQAITELEDENRRLRHALRVRYGRAEAGLPPVPMPDRDLIEAVLNESIAKPGEPADSPNHPQEEPYTVVSEWGRSPEVVANLSGNVSSLIGMAIAVPEGTSQNDLKDLGRQLRKTYDAYDNINIEVYDDEEAARRYADEGSSTEAHRVLSISKHKHSERDAIIVFPNGMAVEVL